MEYRKDDEEQRNSDCQKLSVISDNIRPYGYTGRKLNESELKDVHWCILEYCEEAQECILYHNQMFNDMYPNLIEKKRAKNSIKYFHTWMKIRREGSSDYNEYLYALSCQPQAHNCYSQCEVNGVKFVTRERDEDLKTQNSGVMVETDDEKYYGVLEEVVELIYPRGVSIVVFKCRWFNEGRLSIKRDHGIESINTSASEFEDTPYCLALLAQQVFYIDDPKLDDNWKVINLVNQRGIYKASSLARNIDLGDDDLAYQENTASDVPQIPIQTLHVDLGSLPRAHSDMYHQNDDNMSDGEDDEEEDQSRYHEGDFDSDELLEYESEDEDY